jgi:hypothetical protein
MSLTQEVVDLVEEFGEASADDLAPHLSDFTVAQIATALSNARFRKLLRCVDESKHIGGKAQSRNRYALPLPPEPPKYHPVSSVWDFATRSMEAA